MTNEEKIIAILSAINNNNIFNNNLENKIDDILDRFTSVINPQTPPPSALNPSQLQQLSDFITDGRLLAYKTHIENHKQSYVNNCSLVRSNMGIQEQLGVSLNSTDFLNSYFGSISGVGLTLLTTIETSLTQIETNDIDDNIDIIENSIQSISTIISNEQAKLNSLISDAEKLTSALEYYGILKDNMLSSVSNNILSNAMVSVQESILEENLTKLGLSTVFDDTQPASDDTTPYYDLKNNDPN